MGSVKVRWSAGHTYSYIPLSRSESEIPGCTRSLHAHQHWSSSNSSTVQAAILYFTAPRQFKGTTTFKCSGGARERRFLVHRIDGDWCRGDNRYIPSWEASGNISITFKVPKATESGEKRRKVVKSGGKCTEAHLQKPEVHFPEVKRP